MLAPRAILAICVLASISLSAGAQTIGFTEAAERIGAVCGGDIQKHCKGLNLGGDRIRSCLMNTPALSAACKSEFQKSLQSIDARFAAQAASIRLCDADYRRLCGDVQKGDGNILDCLLKAAKVVSQQCNAALTNSGWR